MELPEPIFDQKTVLTYFRIFLLHVFSFLKCFAQFHWFFVNSDRLWGHLISWSPSQQACGASRTSFSENLIHFCMNFQVFAYFPSKCVNSERLFGWFSSVKRVQNLSVWPRSLGNASSRPPGRLHALPGRLWATPGLLFLRKTCKVTFQILCFFRDFLFSSSQIIRK